MTLPISTGLIWPKIMRVWLLGREKGAPRLTEIVPKSNLTNHRIGDDFIISGIRDCSAGPKIITMDADWQYIMGLSGNSGFRF